VFLGKIFGWTWCRICGLNISPSLSTARTHILAPLQPFSVKNGVQRTIATCGRALWPLMLSVPSSRLGWTTRRISIQSADGKYCYVCKLEMPSYEIKVQLDATVCSLIYFTAKSLNMCWTSQHPSSGVLKTVTAASGTGHNIGTDTSLQCGQIRTGLCESCGRLWSVVGR